MSCSCIQYSHVCYRDKITYKLPILETRQASSDEDILSGDETDSVVDADRMNEEYGSSFDLPGEVYFMTIETCM